MDRERPPGLDDRRPAFSAQIPKPAAEPIVGRFVFHGRLLPGLPSPGRLQTFATPGKTAHSGLDDSRATREDAQPDLTPFFTDGRIHRNPVAAAFAWRRLRDHKPDPARQSSGEGPF